MDLDEKRKVSALFQLYVTIFVRIVDSVLLKGVSDYNVVGIIAFQLSRRKVVMQRFVS